MQRSLRILRLQALSWGNSCRAPGADAGLTSPPFHVARWQGPTPPPPPCAAQLPLPSPPLSPLPRRSAASAAAAPVQQLAGWWGLLSAVAAVVAATWSSSLPSECEADGESHAAAEVEVQAPAVVSAGDDDDGLRSLVAQGRAALRLPDASLSSDEWLYLQRWVDDCTVYRYLMAHGLAVDRAVRAIKATIRWRCRMRIDQLSAQHTPKLQQHIRQHGMWVSRGVSVDGSPVVINRKSELAESDHDAQFNLIVYTLERAIQCQQQRPSSPSPPPSSLHSECRQQWVWMLDLRNFNRQSSTPLSETQRVVDTLQSHYVERLQMAIILDAPLYFSFIFKAVSMFLPAKTKSKVLFVNDISSPVTREKIARVIPLDQLEQPWGSLEPISMQEYIDEEPPPPIPITATSTPNDRPP